jgi:hypothetical protein
MCFIEPGPTILISQLKWSYLENIDVEFAESTHVNPNGCCLHLYWINFTRLGAIHKEKGTPLCLQSATVICHASSEHAYNCTHCKVLHDTTTSIFEAIYHRIIIYHTDHRWCSLAAPQKTSYKQSTSVSEYLPKFSNNVSTTNKTSYIPSGTNKKLSCPASACRRSETSQANPQIIWTCPKSTERPA